MSNSTTTTANIMVVENEPDLSSHIASAVDTSKNAAWALGLIVHSSLEPLSAEVHTLQPIKNPHSFGHLRSYLTQQLLTFHWYLR